MGVNCIWPLEAQLGEGPVWRAAEQAVWFVDIKSSAVHRFEVRTGKTQTWPSPEPIGFIAPTQGGTWIAGLKSGLHTFDPTSGQFTFLHVVEPKSLGNRLNDGFVDRAGRLWFGSMDDAEAADSGALYRLDGKKLTRHDQGYCVTNGPATSPDGRVLYHTDSLRRIIYAFDVSSSGALSGKRVFARLEDDAGFPDGPTVDSLGRVWTGLYGGWGVRCYAPNGDLLDCIRFPCANVTKIAFGGPDLKTIFATTARKGLSADHLADQPLAGGLFQVESDVPGLPQHEFDND